MPLKLKRNKNNDFVARELHIDRPLRDNLTNKRIVKKVELSEKLIQSMIAQVNIGASFESAAVACEVPLASLRTWLEIGAFTQHKATHETIEVPEHEWLCYQLFVKLRKAKAEVFVMCLREIFSSSDWRAKAWYLEKTAGDQFQTKETLKVEIGPVAMNPTGYDFSRLSAADRVLMLELFDRMRGSETKQLPSGTTGEDDDTSRDAVIDIEVVER